MNKEQKIQFGIGAIVPLYTAVRSSIAFAGSFSDIDRWDYRNDIDRVMLILGTAVDLASVGIVGGLLYENNKAPDVLKAIGLEADKIGYVKLAAIAVIAFTRAAVGWIASDLFAPEGERIKPKQLQRRRGEVSGVRQTREQKEFRKRAEDRLKRKR